MKFKRKGFHFQESEIWWEEGENSKAAKSEALERAGIRKTSIRKVFQIQMDY